MDSQAREALKSFIRAEVAADLDVLAGELTRVRRELAAVKAAAGLPVEPLARRERREQTARLRQAGQSVRSIALAVGANRGTVARDLKALGVVPPAGQVVGLDGRTTAPRLRP
jgi:hypothetical protein